MFDELVYALGLVYGFWLDSSAIFKVTTVALFCLLTFAAWAEVRRPDILEKMAKALEPRRR